MAIDTGFLIGYAGWVRISAQDPNTSYLDLSLNTENKPIGGTVVYATDASYVRSLDVPLATSFYLPQNIPTGESVDRSAKSQIRLGFGTYSYNGSISFELTNRSLSLITENFFKRNSIFHVAMCDGEKTLSIPNCVWNQLSISGSPNSTVAVSISFTSNNGYHNNMILTDGDINSPSYDETDRLIPYWQTGIEGIESFSINFNRNVTPVYLNNDLKTPSYLKPGLVNLQVSVVCIEECLDDLTTTTDGLKIKIGVNKTIKIASQVLTNKTYNMSSIDDVGTKEYTWTSIANDTVTNIFSIV